MSKSYPGYPGPSMSLAEERKAARMWRQELRRYSGMDSRFCDVLSRILFRQEVEVIRRIKDNDAVLRDALADSVMALVDDQIRSDMEAFERGLVPSFILAPEGKVPE